MFHLLMRGDLWANYRENASAVLFAQEGASVVAVDQMETAVDETAEMIRAQGGKALSIAADASNEEAVKGYIDHCLQTFGGLDVVYANAGIIGDQVALPEQTVDSWQEVLRVNLISPFLAIKHASAHMAKQGKGSIICTASVAGLRAGASTAPYSASKAGVISLVQTAAHEFYGTGVRVNAICPGLIETGMTRAMFDRARARGSDHKIGQLNPLARAGHPAEIAFMALFLASDDASYVNGQAIAVDGGLSSSLPFVVPKK